MSPAPGTSTPLQLLSSVSQFVELRSIVLRKASTEASVHPEDRAANWTYKQRHTVRHELLGDRNLLRLYPAFEFAAYAAEAPSSPVATLDAEYALTYELKSEANRETSALQVFAEVNGPFVVWPYWRELVQTVTGRLGLAGVVVPVFKVDIKALGKSAPPESPGDGSAAVPTDKGSSQSR